MNKESRFTVREATYEILRRLGLTTIFGNPGSTELPFLKNFPSDFQYILALQEASAVAIADGYAQATGKPALVNLHTSCGTGNGMGNINGAYMNKTPLIILSGQQTREMLVGETYLTNVDETTLPKPWVKWSYQPVRAEDVPAAIMRAYAIALQPPAGPVFLSVPLDDWEKPALGSAVVRTVSTRVAPDPERLKRLADKIRSARNPVLIYGPALEKAGGWDVGVRFAEKLQAPVLLSPYSERAGFPVTHPQFQGSLPPAIGPLCERLRGFDLAVVIGAQVFRYYPYVAGSYLPDGTELLQITPDPNEAATAFVGDSMLSDPRLALEALIDLVPSNSKREWPRLRLPPFKVSSGEDLLYANEVFSTLAEARPADAILLAESTSNMGELLMVWPITTPGSYYGFASGGLGQGAPNAVGVALALKTQGVKRPVVAVIGDGAFQYSIQCLYTAAQHKLPMVFVVVRNGEYGVLKDFAVLEKTPNLPGLDLPGLDIPSIAKGFGCQAVMAKSKTELKEAFVAALEAESPTVITVPVKPEIRALA
ncbi:MAG TPA: benzoylformate decarboxylase [Bryobacteraceae bacterium]|jgi:benzoylformate decarboxylase|nr:benzoylformate decarboxylase [Bryobacteraceae bacterium]